MGGQDDVALTIVFQGKALADVSIDRDRLGLRCFGAKGQTPAKGKDGQPREPDTGMIARGSGCAYRRTGHGVLLCLSLAALGDPMPAQAQDPGEPRLSLAEPADHVDRLNDAAKVTAFRLVVGLTLTTVPTIDREDFVAEIPAAWNGGLACLRLASPDGLYEGRGQFTVQGIEEPGRLAGLEPIVSAENWQEIQARYGGQLMPALTRGGCDQDPVDHALVFARTTTDGSPAIRLAVNAQGATETFVVVQSGAEMTEVSCFSAGEGGGVGFDQLCDIPAEAFAAGDPVLTVNRLTNGEYAPPYVVTLDRVDGP